MLQHILQLIPIQHGVILGCISLHLNVKSFIPILCLYHDIHLYAALMCLCMAYFYWKSVIDTRNAVLTCLVWWQHHRAQKGNAISALHIRHLSHNSVTQWEWAEELLQREKQPWEQELWVGSRVLVKIKQHQSFPSWNRLTARTLILSKETGEKYSLANKGVAKH